MPTEPLCWPPELEDHYYSIKDSALRAGRLCRYTSVHFKDDVKNIDELVEGWLTQIDTAGVDIQNAITSVYRESRGSGSKPRWIVNALPLMYEAAGRLIEATQKSVDAWKADQPAILTLWLSKGERQAADIRRHLLSGPPPTPKVKPNGREGRE